MTRPLGCVVCDVHRAPVLFTVQIDWDNIWKIRIKLGTILVKLVFNGIKCTAGALYIMIIICNIKFIRFKRVKR